MRSRATTARKTEVQKSRAALWTIQLAVDTVADSIHQLQTLQGAVHRGHRAALSTFQTVRHHALKKPERNFVEAFVSRLAERLDWPKKMRSRSRHLHLERSLSHTESRVLGGLAGSAFAITTGLLDLSDQLDVWYGGHAVTAVVLARSAFPNVTSDAHRRRAAKLMLRLDQLCADNRIAWAFASSSDVRGTSGQKVN